MKINLSVYLLRPVTGQNLIDVFTQVASEKKLQLDIDTQYLADSEAYTLVAGPTYSGYGTQLHCGEHFGQAEIDPKQRYVSFSLVNAQIGGLIKAVRISDKQIVDFVREFRLRMIELLADLTKTTSDEIVENSRRLEGSGVNDIRFACDHCNVGLKNNPGICPQCGSPLGNLQPIY